MDNTDLAAMVLDRAYRNIACILTDTRGETMMFVDGNYAECAGLMQYALARTDALLDRAIERDLEEDE